VRSLLELATRIGEYKQKGDLAELEQLKDLLVDVAARIEEDNPVEEVVPLVQQRSERELDQLTSTRVGEVRPYKSVTDPDGENTRPEEARNKRGKHKRRKIVNSEVWFTFLERAFVGALPDDDVYNECCQSDGNCQR